MYKKILLRLLAGLTALLLLAALLLMANSFVGNPFTAGAAKQKGREYLKERYGHLDLKIEEVAYNPKDSSYSISVLSGTSRDTHFSLAYREGEIYLDNYEDTVLSGMNTMDRLCDEYKKRLTSLVQANMGGVVSISVMPEKLNRYDLDLDAPFDERLVQNVEISVRTTGGNDAEHLADTLKALFSLMMERGYGAARFSITGEREGDLTELMNISAAHVAGDDLEAVLQRAITETEYDGIIAFSKGLK
ncbi:MAG: hypothetical protein ACOX30_09510 [Dethiobacteria bacterium]|jgi:hypothetical protein